MLLYLRDFWGCRSPREINQGFTYEQVEHLLHAEKHWDSKMEKLKAAANNVTMDEFADFIG